MIDSRSVKATAAGGPRGYAAEKKINGRKRHLLTDTTGLMLGAISHPPDVQDRDGAPSLLASVRYAFPWLCHVYADAADTDEKLHRGLKPISRWAANSWSAHSSQEITPR